MKLELIYKEMPSKKPELGITIVFLLKNDLELILSNTRQVGYYKVDFQLIWRKLLRVGLEVELILKQKVVELVEVWTIKSI